MDFSSNKPIYRQIIDFSFGNILTGKWPPGDKIPSVRELAIELTVNSHTVLKAYEYLQNSGVINVRRGMGYFLSTDAKEKVNQLRRDEFFNTTLKELFNEMKLLDIPIEEIVNRYRRKDT